MNKKQMIGEEQNSRHGSTQGLSNDNSNNEAAQPSQQEDGCSKTFGVPFSLSKLVSHLHEKHYNVDLPVHAVAH